MPTAFGFTNLESLFSQRVAEVGMQRIYTAIQESAAEHTRYINGMLAQFVERVTDVQEQYELPSGGTLQPLDENGIPLPTEPSGSYQVAFPIQGGGTAWGGNRVANAQMTVAEANRRTVEAQNMDADWMARHILAGVLDNVAWTYKDKGGANGAKGLGDITIQPLANGDSVAYVRRHTGLASTDDHYLAQAAAISDGANPFPTIRAELIEHPSNGGDDARIIVYVASNLVATIKGLAGFVAKRDSNIVLGANSDRLASEPTPVFGTFIGYTDECWIVEWGKLPSGYMLAHAVDGGPVLGMREYPQAELQGFFSEMHSPDGALKETRMIRYAGIGVRNRVGAVVYQIGNASYQVPSGFDAPLPA